MERFNLKKLNDVEGKEQFCVEVTNRFAAVEDLATEVEINSAWDTIRENIKISAKESLGCFELKKHKPWFDEGCSKLLDQWKQAKLQRLQYPRRINGFKKGYQPRNNLVKDKNGDLLADFHNILNRWKNYCSQLLNVHNVIDVRQIEVRTAEPLVPGPSHLEVEIAIAKLKSINHQVVIKFQQN
jgi:hypothetical protein